MVLAVLFEGERLIGGCAGRVLAFMGDTKVFRKSLSHCDKGIFRRGEWRVRLSAPPPSSVRENLLFCM